MPPPTAMKYIGLPMRCTRLPSAKAGGAYRQLAAIMCHKEAAVKESRSLQADVNNSDFKNIQKPTCKMFS